MRWRSRVSRLGLLWVAVAFLLLITGTVLQWVNFSTHNGYRLAGIYIEPVAVVLMGAAGLVNSHQVRRGHSLAERNPDRR